LLVFVPSLSNTTSFFSLTVLSFFKCQSTLTMSAAPGYHSDGEEPCTKRRKLAATQRIVCSDDEDDVPTTMTTTSKEPIRVEIADTRHLIAALEEVSPLKTDNSVTLRLVNRVQHASECSIPAFNIKDSGSEEAQSIMGLAEELRQEVTGIVITAMLGSTSSIVTMTIEAQSVTGLAEGKYKDVKIMARRLLSVLVNNKNKAINITLYPNADTLGVLIYDLSECYNFIETFIPIHDIEKSEADDTEAYVTKFLKFEFSRMVFVHIHDILAVTKDKDPTSKFRISQHQITDRESNETTRIVSMETFSDDSDGVTQRKNWIVKSDASDKATSCVGGGGGGGNGGQTEPTQTVMRGHSKMMKRVAALETLVRQSVRPDMKNVNLLDCRIHYRIGVDNQPIQTSEANAKYTYHMTIHATFVTKTIVNMMQPLDNSKRRIGIMFPNEADRYMMVVAPLGGTSRMLYFAGCLRPTDETNH
jgi:hypothetical protein